MSEDAERGDLGEWCSKHREWTHPDAPCWDCQKEAEAERKVERLEARVKELEEVLGPFAGSPLNDPRYERYIVQDPPLSTVGVKRVDFFRAAAALKGGDAE